MKNLMKAFGIALLLSGVFVFSNTSAQTTPTTTPTQTAPPAKTTPPPAVKPNTDKMLGKDAKGHQLYQGPKGGTYYIDAKGNKVYTPKTPATTPTPASTTPPKN